MGDDDARDESARLTAAFDQHKQATRETAETIAMYWATLRLNGLCEADALQLTLQYQSFVLAGAVARAVADDDPAADGTA